MAAEIYQIPRGPDGRSYYDQSGTSPPLRRSTPSSSSLFLDTTSKSLPSSPKRASFSPPPLPADKHGLPDPHSAPPSTSSWNSSPPASTTDFSSLSSWNSTPSSSGLSLDTQLGRDEGDDLHFPLYDSVGFNHRSSDETPPDSDAPEPSTTTDTTQSNSPLPTPTIADDTAVKQEPSRHVDYLSHEWREEDIWASWRHIVSQRKVYGQRSRLENASWRTWAKSKYRLSTVPPEKLNWLKESDVTWLYGPLTPAVTHPITTDASQPASHISRNSSFINKKPILKKRSMSEAMLQKSLSTSSLVKQAAASVQAQQGHPHTNTHRPFGRIATPFALDSEPPSREDLDYFSQRTSSVHSDSTPGEAQQEKHIRFDEKVEQCIAVECKEGDVSDDEHDAAHPPMTALSESSSDEGLVMMRPNPRRHQGRRKGEKKSEIDRSSSSVQTRMIEEIEATTLKSRTDGPEVTQEAQHHVFGGVSWGSTSRKLLSPSPSQETLRPSRPSRNFLLATDDDDDDDDEDNDNPTTANSSGSTWSFGASNPRSSLGAAATSPPSSFAGASSSSTGYSDGYDGGIEGMRRTESGMFMPYDEDDEDAIIATGLFGRVSETFNTMRDIGHVLYTAFRT